MKFLGALWVLAYFLAAASYPLGLFVVSTMGVKANLVVNPGVDKNITGAAEREKEREKVIETNKGMFEMDAPKKDDPEYAKKVMEIYGKPSIVEAVFLFIPKERFFHPPEMPSLTLLRVTKDDFKNEVPVEGAPFLFFAQWISHGCAIGGVVLLCLWTWLRCRVAKRAPAA